LIFCGGTADAPVKFSPGASTYSVGATRVLDGSEDVRFKFRKKESKWMEMPQETQAAGGLK
jgi:hypothetical protein